MLVGEMETMANMLITFHLPNTLPFNGCKWNGVSALNWAYPQSAYFIFIFFFLNAVLVTGALEDHDEVILLRAQHHLVLESPQPQEGEFVGGIQVQDHLAGLFPHRLHNGRVVQSQVVFQGSLYGYPVIVHHNYSDYVLKGLKAL